MKPLILFVDDEPNILEGYQRKLHQSYYIRTAEGPEEGLRMIEEEGPFAVVVSDMTMPVMNGVAFLERVKSISPDTVRMMLTGNNDINTAMQAVNDGNVFRFMTKPCSSPDMAKVLDAGIEQNRLITAEKKLLDETLNGSVELLAEILSWVNPDNFGRTVRMRSIVNNICRILEIADPWEIRLAVTLSRIGCMAIPQIIFAKIADGVELNSDEQEALSSIPTIGHDLIKEIPRLETVARIIRDQEKRFSNRCTPGVDSVDDKIPLGARILRVANDYHDHMMDGLSSEEACAEMKKHFRQYDPAVLAAADQLGSCQPGEDQAWHTREINLGELCIGHVLVSDITAQDRKLVIAGTVITEALLVRLGKFNEVLGVDEPIEVQDIVINSERISTQEDLVQTQ